MALTALLTAAALSLLSGQPPMSRRGLGLLTGQAGLAAAATTLGIPSAMAAPAIILPYTQQMGVKLSTGQQFPFASFGLQVYDDATAQKLTTLALKSGYRNFFASVLAGNQRGFARAVKESGIPREELFICGSVLSNRAQGFEAAKKLTAKGCAENMEAFAVGGIEYLDMIMVKPTPPLPACHTRYRARTTPPDSSRTPRFLLRIDI